MIDLTGKVALITGAANGLGKALSIELHQRGCHLALVDNDLENLEKMKNSLRAEGQQVSIHHIDVSKEIEIAKLREAVIDIHGRLDILINNAGVSISQPFEQLALEDFKHLFEVNFWGSVYVTKFFLNDLKAQRNSFLVNIISGFALTGFPGKTSYSSSKGALMSFTNSLRTELADSVLSVSLVIPPPLDTQLIKRGKHINDEKKLAEVNYLKNNGMPLDKAAKIVTAGFTKGRYRIVVGRKMFWTDVMSRLFPGFVHKMIGRNKNKFDFV